MGPYRPENDNCRSQARDSPDSSVQHVPRRSEDVVVEHKRSESVRQGHLHVPGEHRPDDQSDRLPAGGR